MISKFQNIFDNQTAAEGFVSLENLIKNNSEHIRLIHQNYDETKNPVWNQSLFLENWIKVEVFELIVEFQKAHIKSDLPLRGCIYYFDQGSSWNKECVWPYDSEGEKTPIDVEVELYDKNVIESNTKNLYIVMVNNELALSNGRILESGANIYVSKYPIDDNFQPESGWTGLEYFLYIGIPIMCGLFLIFIIVCSVLIITKKKKEKKEKETENADETKPTESNSNLNTKTKENPNHYPLQNQPITNPMQAGAFPVPYNGQPNQNGQMPFVYMMPVPMNQPNGNNSEAQRLSGNTKNPSNASQFTGFGGSQPVYMMPYPPANVKPNHYELPVNEPQGNKLKINSIGNLPDEDEVPVFEVNLENVDKYGGQQKFN